MPKQRGGWKGKPKSVPYKKRAAEEDNDPLYDEVDKYHNKKSALAFDESEGDDDEDAFDEAPVFDMKADESDDDEEEEDEDDEDDDDDDDDDERRAEAIKREEQLTSAWGKNKASYYNTNEEAEIDEEAAAAEEQEAIRLQRKRAAELEDDDITFGTAKKGGKAEKAASDALGSKLTGRAKAAVAANESSSYKVKKDLSQLSEQQKLDILMADTPELLGLLEELKTQVAEVRNTLLPILDAVKAGKIKNKDGLPYLEAKQQILLTYITDITFYLLLKAEGKSVRDHPVIEQLVHVRTLLERMRPLDAKMSTQIMRLLKAAKSAPKHKAESKVEESDEEEDADEASSEEEEEARDIKQKKKGTAKKGAKRAAEDDLDAAIAQLQGVDEEGHDAEITGGVYRPLRRAAVMYDDDPVAAKKAREAERRKKKISESAMLADLRAKYSEAPEEMEADGGAGAITKNAKDAALERLAREREAFEEEAFTRVGMTKEEKKARKARERERARWDNLADLEQFGDIDEVLAPGKPSKQVSMLPLKAKKAPKMDNSDIESAEGDFDGGATHSGHKRKRASGGASDSGDEEDDAYYAAISEAAARKKARRHDAYVDKKHETSEYIRSRPDEDELHDPEGHRKASKTILQNRGLVKYRKKDDKNPRTHYRKKAEKAVKRRKGQVVPMRDSGKEAGMYGGEVTGIRTNVTHSRKIRS